MKVFKFTYPSIKWTQKHGNVYCSNCKNKSKLAMIPTIKKSVTFRKNYASCEDCLEIVRCKISRYFKINYDSDYSDAAFSIGHIYG